jgi:hypothetical protein
VAALVPGPKLPPPPPPPGTSRLKRNLGIREVSANATPYGPRQVEFVAVCDVPFDSENPARHMHRVALRFAHDGARWNFMGNCTPWPGKPQECT